MSWSIRWSFVAEHVDLLKLHWRTAERLDAAVMLFAATGRGGVRIEAESLRWVVRVPGADAQLLVDPNERIVHVVRVFARR